MDIDEMLRRCEEAEEAIRQGEETVKRGEEAICAGESAATGATRKVFDGFMSGIVPYYGDWFAWQRLDCPCRALRDSVEYEDLFEAIDQCQRLAHRQEFGGSLRMRRIEKYGKEKVRIEYENKYADCWKRRMSVDIPIRYLRMTPDELHELIEAGIAETNGRRS